MAIPTEKPSYGPLDGVKVVYAAVELACPKAADLMADWGADVTWLENTGAGDTIRDTAYIKQAERRNQRSVALNYFSEEGREIFLNMIRDADIFMEASKGGTWARKGLTDEVLWAVNPEARHRARVRLRPDGRSQDGQARGLRSDGYGLCRDHHAERYRGAADAAGALCRRLLQHAHDRKLGSGRPVQGREVGKRRVHRFGHVRDASGYRPVLPGGLLERGHQVAASRCAQPESLRHWRVRLQGRLLGRVPLWRRPEQVLLETIGLGHLWGTPEIPEDTSGLWLSNPHAEEIQRAFEEYCLAHSKYEIEEDFAAHRIAAQVINDMEDLVEEEHLRLRDTWVDWETADGKTFHGLGVFPKFQNNPGRIWRPMPAQGGDTVDVLTKLGYSDEQIARFAADGIVKCAE